MIYGLNFNGTQLPDEARAFPKKIRREHLNCELKIVGMTNKKDLVRCMIITATNGKRILSTREKRVGKVTWWAIYAGY